MIKKIKNKYSQKIKRQFLKMDDLNLMKKKIIKEGYSTNKITKIRNVSYFTAKDNDRNKIQFIRSNKHTYIILSLNFSNMNTNYFKVFSSNKNFEIIDFEKAKKYFKKILSNITFRANIYTYSSNRKKIIKNNFINFNNLIFVKNSLFESKNKKNNVDLNISNIRNYIISKEIKDLPNILELTTTRRTQLIKKIGSIFINYTIRNPEIIYIKLYENGSFIKKLILINEKISNKHLSYNYLYKKELLNKIDCSEEEFYIFFNRYVIPFILENKNIISKKYLENNKDFHNIYEFENTNTIAFTDMIPIILSEYNKAINKDLFKNIDIVNECWETEKEINFNEIFEKRII